MDFSARSDIEAPLNFVYGEITDFTAFERAVMRRGADVSALDGPTPPAIGAGWDIKFRMRGRQRQIRATIAELVEQEHLLVDFDSSSVNGICRVELVPLSPLKTRIHVSIKSKAKSIPGKLLFQSMRLGRKRMKSRFKSAVETYADGVEARFRNQG